MSVRPFDLPFVFHILLEHTDSFISMRALSLSLSVSSLWLSSLSLGVRVCYVILSVLIRKNHFYVDDAHIATGTNEKNIVRNITTK